MTNAKMSKRTGRRWKWMLALPIVIGLLTGAGLWYLRSLGITPGKFGVFHPPFRGLKQVNVLILGVDSDSEPRRSDTIMVAALDLARRRIGVISIPRDFRVAIPGHDAQKINAAYTLGGVELSAETIKALTGVQCDYHIKVTSKGLERLVDTLGGVVVNVDKRMLYHDHWGGLYIDLQPGVQRLNGKQAVGFVRFRHDRLGDLTRIQRQQIFMRAVMHEALQPRNLAHVPRLLKVFGQAVETDLTLVDLRAMADLARGLEPGQMKTGTLPGLPTDVHGVSYLDPDYQQVPRVVAEVLYGARPVVGIVNATAIPGVEAGLVKRLTAEGYQVSEVRFADYTRSNSKVMDTASHSEEVAQIRHWLNCGAVVRANGESLSGADITVLLGTDYMGKENH